MEDQEQPGTHGNAMLFVYGTLRKGFRSHGFLRGLHARFVTVGHVQGRLYDMGVFPGAVESGKRADRVHGELYLLPSAASSFRVLDRYEGFDRENSGGNQFVRKVTEVKLAGDREVRAWIYWMGTTQRAARRVLSGDYSMCQK